MAALFDRRECEIADTAVVAVSGPLVIEAITSYEEFLALEQEWNDLVSQSCHGSVFLRHEWFAAWWSVYGQNRELFVLVARRGYQMVGVAPLMRCRRRLRFAPLVTYEQVRFMENGEATHVDFIIRRCCEGVVTDFISYLGRLRRSWTMVYLRKVREDSLAASVIGRSIEGLTVRGKEAMRSPVLTVAGSWQGFYESRSKTCRKSIRLAANRIKSLGEVTVSRVTDAAGWQEVMPSVWEVGANGSRRGMGWSVGQSAETRAFLSALAMVAARHKWLSVWLLSVDGKPLAFEYHLRYGDEIFALRAEYDKRYEKYSPGFCLDCKVVESCFDDGIVRYNMGGADNFYKLRWTSDVEPHLAVFLYSGNLLSRILCGAEFRLLPLLSRRASLHLLRGRLQGFVGRLRNAYAEHGPLGIIPAIAARAARIAFGSNRAWWFERDLSRPVVPAAAAIALTFHHNNADATIKWLRTLGKPSVVDSRELAVARQEGHYLVNVRHAGKIIGYVKLGFGRVYVQDYERVVRFSPHDAFIYDSFVLPEYRRKGVASAAIESCMRMLHEKGYRRVYCHIPQWNEASIGAYTRAGFRRRCKLSFRRVFGLALLPRTDIFSKERVR